MALTVGKPGSAGSKTVQKRTSLRDRQRVQAINEERENKSKSKLKQTEEITDNLPASEATRQEIKQKTEAQATVRQLNESAERSGAKVQYSLVERDGQLQIQKTEIERRNASTAAGVGGPQQIPALQSQISSQQQTTKTEYTPVGSSREGGVILRESTSGRTFTEVGTSASGAPVLLSTPEFVNTGRQAPKVSDRLGSGFAAPGVFLSPQRRQDVVDAGTFLREGGVSIQETTKDAPVVFKAAGAITGYGSRALGAGLERLGSDPQKTVAFEVVLPSSGGALLGAATGAAVRGTPAVLESFGVGTSRSLIAGKVVGQTLGAAGYASLGATVLTREAEEQSVDVLFAGAGARAGARPTTGLDTGIKDPVFYGGAPTPNRASRLNLRTAGKPATKAEIRKQSFNQAYNPNFVQKPGYLKVKSPTTGETRIYIQQAGKQKNLVFTREIITKTTSKTPGVQRVQGLETKRSIGFQTPKTTYEQVSFPTPKGRVTQTRVAYGKEVFNYDSIKGSPSKDVSSGSSVSKQVFKQKVVNVGNLPVPKTVRSVGKENPVFNNPQQTINSVPSYELKPNAQAQYSAYAEGRLVGGAQPGRGRVYENIVARAKLKNAGRTDFVLVDAPATPVSAAPAPPVRDLALSGRFANLPSVAADRGVTSLSSAGSTVTGLRPSGVVYEVQPTTTISRPIQNVKPFTTTFQTQDRRTSQTVVPALTVIGAERSLSTPKVFQQPTISSYTVVPPGVRQVPVAAQRSVVEQRNEQRSQLVQATGFDFRGTAPPTLRFDTPVTPPFVPAPSINRTPGKPRPETYRPYREVGTPATPARFGFPEKARTAAQYEVTVGAKGNKYFFDLGRGGTEVLTKARDLAKGTAAASIRVKPLGRSSSDVGAFLGSDFVRNKAGVYVQKTETRISSSGEKAQIPGASKSKRLTKGTAYGEALNKVSKGASLRSVRRSFF